ncbi:MAG: SDR family oxidoreductase [Fluviicoccus sp.]|uniref:SDR family NAD(P)-dependent oxidoreductase n=1 Tax=Fluviicoccus sp. TaxID=2003552 RepID=UPI002718638E|nr:SDR family oxidoreductase [Fluviicoccus sp.]MDO8331140.1 SDR family oxidoreductase [Fluviicoccus sp.]
MNPLALVTGASDGIGLEFCRLLAARGYDLILVARRQSLLEDIATQLTLRHAIRCHVIPCDLSLPQAAETVFGEVRQRGLSVDLLINNAGLLFNGFFHELPLRQQESLLAVNVVALTSLCHLFVNDMAERGGGQILNLASLAAWTPIPNQNVYAASKAYVLAFSLALADEMKAAGSGVHVCALCPGYTRTAMLDNPAQGGKLALPGFLLHSAEDVAREGLDACLAGRTVCMPGAANRLGAVATRLLPRLWQAKVMGRGYRLLQG